MYCSCKQSERKCNATLCSTYIYTTCIQSDAKTNAATIAATIVGANFADEAAVHYREGGRRKKKGGQRGKQETAAARASILPGWASA